MMSAEPVSKNHNELLHFYDAALGRLTVPYRTHFIPTSYGSTHVLSAGVEGAEPVLILHGAASSAAGCWPLINGLASKYRVYAPDAPRQLGKTEAFRLSSRNAEHGKWLAEVLDRFGIENTKVVGFSFGGWMACRLAIHAPHRVDRLALLSPVGVAPFRFRYWLRAPALFFPMLMFRSEGSIRRFSRFLAGPTASEELMEELVASAAVFLKNFHMQEMPYRIFRSDLKKIAVSTMLLVGRHDAFFDPEKVVARIQGNLPKSQAEIVADAGHVVYYEKPEFVSSRMIAFFENEDSC